MGSASRLEILLLGLLVCLLSTSVATAALMPPVNSSRSGSPTGTTMTLSAMPAPLETGLVTLQLRLAQNGTPLAQTPVAIAFYRERRMVLNTTVTTDDVGVANIKVWVDDAGYYTFDAYTDTAHEAFQVHVHGLAVLVSGFLVALAVLLAILLDRL